jgi:ABC-2 type transport system ATP-binding protein
MLPSTLKGRIGYVPQQDELVNMLTGSQQIALTAALHSHWNRALIDRLQRTWDVPMDRTVQRLSGGERQKLSMLLALGHEPELLVLDEPVAAFDPLSRRQFLSELLEITADRDRTVLFSTHIVSDLERVADQIWVVRDGALLWQGALDTLKESVVRLDISSKRLLPASLPIRGIISQRVSGSRATAVLEQWNDAEYARARENLDADIRVEPMGLEDVFVELHS